MNPNDVFDEERYRPTAADALPAADLTELLAQAAGSRAYEPELHRRLLTDSLIIMVQEWPEPEALGSGEQIPIMPLFLQGGELPVFTGRDALFANPDLDPDNTPHILVQGRELLSMIPNQAICLNPFTVPSLEMSAGFVAKLLAGNYPRQVTASQLETIVSDKEMMDELMRVPPEREPLAEQLHEQLTLLFRQHPRVRQAYLVWQKENEELSEPCFALYVEIGGANERLVQEITYVASKLLNKARVNLRILFNPNANQLLPIGEQLQLAPFYQD